MEQQTLAYHSGTKASLMWFSSTYDGAAKAHAAVSLSTYDVGLPCGLNGVRRQLLFLQYAKIFHRLEIPIVSSQVKVKIIASLQYWCPTVHYKPSLPNDVFGL